MFDDADQNKCQWVDSKTLPDSIPKATPEGFHYASLWLKGPNGVVLDRIQSNTVSNYQRKCTDELTNWTRPGLAQIFTTNLDGVDGPATGCLKATDSAVSLRLEIKDRKGLWVFDTSFDANLGKVLSNTLTANSIDALLLTTYGLISIRGTGTSSNPISTELRFADLPTYAEALQSKMDEMKSKCSSPNLDTSNGWTTAQCASYSPPTQFWWQSNATNLTQQDLDEANNRITDPNTSISIGNLIFNGSAAN